jgi:hypothetical protein
VEDNRTSWPIIVGITAGVIGALAAAAIIYAVREEEPETKLRDAKDIIAQCQDQIRDIEAGIQRLRQSAA